MSRKDKNKCHYFQIKDINCFDELRKFLDKELKVLLNNSNKEFIFRGDSNYSDKLQPKLFRKNNGKYLIEDHVDRLPYDPLTDYKKVIFSMFEAIKRFYDARRDVGDGNFSANALEKFNFSLITENECKTLFKEYINEIGLAQHNGMPTIGLDFTYDYKIALYFLITGDYNDNDWQTKWIKENSCLWIFKSSIFDDNNSPNQNLIKHDLDYKINNNAFQQKGLLCLCLNVKNRDLKDFCVFNNLKENVEFFNNTVILNGMKFQNIQTPLAYKLIISPKAKKEIVNEFNCFKDLPIWSKDFMDKIIEKEKISIKLNEIYNNSMKKINNDFKL
ncbi:FRG domain-containing protein [Methanobrevibacter curvatus]|uniref:FRG domain protein n=1 Tax=Methanobrevibacter curvatus TaxID=49547 RepID=A0A166AKC1_9EURY|nr:FRG domain-containing protein [Methanobrevibacter curvatus]KZX12146.1 FRG domain protein [Methanobrevibacter curvatus]